MKAGSLSDFWIAVWAICLLAADYDRPVVYHSRIDGLLMPWYPQ